MTKLMRDDTAITRSIICEYAGKQMIDMPELAKRCGIPTSTFYSRLKNPESFRLYELRIVCNVLRIPAEERGELI